jgi:hypothetical protein
VRLRTAIALVVALLLGLAALGAATAPPKRACKTVAYPLGHFVHGHVVLPDAAHLTFFRTCTAS